MIETTGRILKSKDVVFEGQYYLDTARIMTVKAKTQERGAIADPARVRILENCSEYAIIEVTCACGIRICLRCDYVGVPKSDNSQAPNATIAAPN